MLGNVLMGLQVVLGIILILAIMPQDSKSIMID